MRPQSCLLLTSPFYSHKHFDLLSWHWWICVTHCLANKQTGLNNGEKGLGLVVVRSVGVEEG